MSVQVPLTEESARVVLQAEWDDAARAFADGVVEKCSHVEDASEHRDDVHSASDLWLDLDDCWPCDDDAGVNFVYGQLHGVHAIALKLGVELDESFPPRPEATQ